MQKFEDVVQDRKGNVVPGASVLITDLDDGAVMIFDVNSTATPVSSTLISDSKGRWSFYGENGHYKAVASIAGEIVDQLDDILLYDSEDDTDKASKAALAASGGAALVGSNDGASGALWTTMAGFVTRIMSSAGASVMGYLAPWTGAIASTVEDELNQQFHARSFMSLAQRLNVYLRLGTVDVSGAIQTAIDAAAVVFSEGTSNNDIVTAKVILPAGRMLLSSPLTLKNCVHIQGQGSGATELIVTAAINGLQTTTGQFSNVRLIGFTLSNNGSGLNGIDVVGLIRNCVFDDVVVRRFQNWVRIRDSWTLALNNCCGYNAANYGIYMDTGCGEIFVNGGRYDVAGNHLVYANCTAGELTMRGAAVQFGSKSSIYTDSIRTVLLKDCFFEGSCIGSLTDYYVRIQGEGGTLSSVVIEDCVFNDLNDSNRSGLGIIYVAGVESFTYRERWSRNGTTNIPVIGAGVASVDVSLGTSANPATLLTQIAAASDNYARIKQLNRPHQFYGMDMNGAGSVDVTTKSAWFGGLPSLGVAIGTYNSIAAIQAKGASDKLWLNPHNGETAFGQKGAKVSTNTNEFFGKWRFSTQLTSSSTTPADTTGNVRVDCSGANRSVTMTNVANNAGAIFIVGKRDTTANSLTVTPASGLIGGAATLVITASKGVVTLIGDGTDWEILFKNY
jgi:hypothetical protein